MSQSPDTFNIGSATIDVTPDVGIHLGGFASRVEPSEGMYHPLRAVVTVIDDGSAPLALVSIEWLGFYDRTEEARSRIAAAAGIAPERIVLCGTHTHCGPALRRPVDLRRHGELDEEYVDRTLDALAQAAVQAMESREPARLRFGIGWCGFAASRRAPDGKGGVIWKPSLDAPHDHEVPVLTVESPDGELRQVLFSYSCHPTGAGAIRLIGGGYISFAYDWLDETYPGAAPCFFQGCAGDQKPNAPDAAGAGFRLLTIDEIRELGHRLGQAVQRVIQADDLRPVGGGIDVAQSVVKLTRPMPDRAVVEAAHMSDKAHVAGWSEHYSKLMEQGEDASWKVPFEIQTVRFGDSLAIVTLAGEVNVDYGLRLKRELGRHFRDVLVIAYANDIVGYVHTRRQITEGGYEVWGNAQHLLAPGPFAAETEEEIVAALHRALGYP